MCLAVPMLIDSIDKTGVGVASLDGSEYRVNLSLTEDPQVGDYVIVHAGFAIEKLDEKEARERLSLFEEIGVAV